MTLLQWKEDFISETLHHSTHKLSSCLLVLNLRTLWDLQKPAQGLTLISEGAVAVLNTWLILPWVHAHVWSCSKALGLCTSSGNGKWRFQLGLCTPSPAQLQGHPQALARAGCWEAAKFLGCCCCLFYLLEPHRARQSQMGLGLVHVECGAVLVLGTSSPEIFPFPCKQTKSFPRVPLSLFLPQVSVPCPILPWDTHAGALALLGTKNPILPTVLRKPEPVLIHWKLCFHLHLSLHNCIIRACCKHTFIFQGKLILLFFLSNYRRHLLVWPSSLSSSFIATRYHSTKQF